MARASTLTCFNAFELVKFPGIPDSADIYYAHPYVHNDVLLLVMPISFQPPGDEQSGIFVAKGHVKVDDSIAFDAPWCLFRSPTWRGRTIDVNTSSGLLTEMDNC